MIMKLFRMLGRNIRDALKSVTRNFSLSIASVSCISITLIVVALSLLISKNVENFSKIIKEDVTIVVFLNSDTTEEGLKAFEEEIKKDSNIESYVYKSKIKTKEEMMKESEVFNSIMSTWDEDESPLKDSYLVKVKNILEIDKTVEMIKNLENIEVVDWGEGMVEKLIQSFNLIEKIAIVLVLVLVLVTVFLIINTIKLTIFSRKREISIMRLVGASNFSIKNPFVIEGMIIGIIGSIVPIAAIIYGYNLFYNYFDGKLFSDLIKLIEPYPFTYEISLIVLALGMIVGMIGSAKAVRKYLKV